MQNMHSNRISQHNTSAALGNDAILRIRQGVEESKVRKASKHQSSTIKKTASLEIKPVEQPIIKIAGIHEVPETFEKIGTGFYRQGHHLWELKPSDNGFTLARKHGEDHVLGYDPEPVIKVSRSTVVDRFGSVIKTGSKIIIPHKGKIAGATVIVVQPGALQVELNTGEAINVPPDMAEICEECPEPFEPNMEPSSKAEPQMVQEQESEDHEEMEEHEGEEEPEHHIASRRVAAPPDMELPNEPQVEEPTEQVPPQLPPPSKRSEILALLESAPIGTTVEVYPKVEGSKYSFIVQKTGDDKFELFTMEQKRDRFATYNTKQLIDWEFSLRENVGDIGYRKASSLVVALMSKISSLINHDDIETWNSYWYDLGQRIAGMRKPLTPEQREKRKERRKERKIERMGLPKGVKLPPRKPEKQPKVGAKDTDQLAKVKERNTLLEQTLDRIRFLTEDDTFRDNEGQFIDELNTVFQEYEQELEDINTSEQDSIEDELSIETPPEDENTSPMLEQSIVEQPKTSSKVSVSMKDLL